MTKPSFDNPSLDFPLDFSCIRKQNKIGRKEVEFVRKF